LQDPPKFTQIGIFGLKIYHLATLVTRVIPHRCVDTGRTGEVQFDCLSELPDCLRKINQFCVCVKVSGIKPANTGDVWPAEAVDRFKQLMAEKRLFVKSCVRVSSSRGRCYEHNFLRFLPIFDEKNGVFLINQCYDPNFTKLGSILSKFFPIFSQFFGRKYFISNNIGHRALFC
jgi:hypothetical protein